MNNEKLIEFLSCNEPVFEYKGQEYGICWTADGLIFGVSENDKEDQLFTSPEELLDNLVIDGDRFKDIAGDVLKEYFV